MSKPNLTCTLTLTLISSPSVVLILILTLILTLALTVSLAPTLPLPPAPLLRLGPELGGMKLWCNPDYFEAIMGEGRARGKIRARVRNHLSWKRA